MRKTATLATLLLTLVAMGVGCVEDTTFMIRQNQIPAAGCLPSTTTTDFRAEGVLDVVLGVGYYLFPLVENNLRSTLAVDGQPERNILRLDRFEIVLDLGEIPGDYPEDETSFSEKTSGTLYPADTIASTVKVIKDKLAKRLATLIPKGGTPVATMSVTMKAIAKLQGSDKESSEFYYPIKICNGCLVDYRSSCPASTDTTIKTNECGLPQDTVVTCCTDPTKGSQCYKTE